MKKYLLATLLFAVSLHIMPMDSNINLDEVSEKTISLIQANIEEAKHCNDEVRIQSLETLLEDIKSKSPLEPHIQLRITLDVLRKRTTFNFDTAALKKQNLDDEFTQLQIILFSIILDAAISAYFANQLEEMNQYIMLADSIENGEVPKEAMKNLAAQMMAMYQLQKEHVAQAAAN